MSSDENGVGTAELWTRHAHELVRYATVLVGPSDAHDVVSDAFLRATATHRDLAAMAHARAYLYRAVTNEARNRHRGDRRRRARDLAAVQPATTIEDDPLLDVRRAMAALSVRQRAVVFLIYWADMTEAGAGELLGIAPGSVRRHLVRARTQLRRALS